MSHALKKIKKVKELRLNRETLRNVAGSFEALGRLAWHTATGQNCCVNLYRTVSNDEATICYR